MNAIAHTLWGAVKVACFAIGALSIVTAFAIAVLVMADEAREARRADDDLDTEFARLLDQENDR